MKINLIASMLYNSLIMLWKTSEVRVIGRIWRILWNKTSKAIHVPVRTKIHGKPVVVNYGYTYPCTARKFKTFNNPLVELIHQAFLANKQAITFIDVGAAVGDTVLLIYANCEAMIKKFYCVEGDAEFFEYLQSNLNGFEDGELFFAVLSDKPTTESALVRTHKGTASAQGKEQVTTVPLDSLFPAENELKIDVIKIDVDGFDGKVIKGAMNLIQRDKSAVIFEWHPILYEQTKNDWRQPFQRLEEIGYTDFLWFNKFGVFSHFMHNLDLNAVENMAELCKNGNFEYDWHYDVIALHHSSSISRIALAEMIFAKTKPSSY